MSEKNPRRPPPLDRKKILSSLVSSADSFSLLQYDERRRDTPAIGELEQKGKLPNMPAVLADTGFALWAHEPGIKDEVPADQRYWRDLLKQTSETSAFKGLAAQTRADWLLSTMGTIETARGILRLVPKEDADKLEQVAKEQSKADMLEQKAQQAEEQAQALEQLLQQMTQNQSGMGQAGQDPSGSQSSGGSVGLTAEQAQQLAGELAKAQAAAGQARQLADAAKANANTKADELLGQPGSREAEAKLTELRRLGMGAVKQAAEKVEEASDTIRSWGLEPGELNKLPVPEALGLLEKMKKNADFKAFTKLLGRLRAVAKKAAKDNDKGESRQVPRQETGWDLSRAQSSELAAYAMGGVMQTQMLTRWANGTLRLHGAETRNKPKGKGPVVACRDSSGSMEGDRQKWATGVHLALTSYAKVQKRSFGSIIFDSVVQLAKVFKAGAVGAPELLEIVETHTGGGTDFKPPLERAREMIDKEGLEKADIVFITDGECALDEKFLKEFLAWKEEKRVRVLTVIVDDHVSDATVQKFSDQVVRASSFTAEEAEKLVFANLS